MDSKAFQILVEACEDAGYEPYAYSGRGMYGAKCVALDCENPVRAALKIAGALCESGNPELVDELSRGGATWDSMGRECVLYFERVAWQEQAAGVEAENEDVAALARMTGARTEEHWWAWHDADASRWSPGEANEATAEAERRCAAWVAGESEDGPEVSS